MDTLTVRLRIPTLARLLLAELATRRGVDEGVLLARLIRHAAVAELEGDADERAPAVVAAGD